MAAVLLLALLWARAAEAGECNQPPKLENGSLQSKYLNKKTFADGSKVYYVCDPGYTFRQYSPRFITCNEGVWEPLQAACTPKSCGSPGEIMNGYYQGDNTFGRNVTFYCNEGYKLVGRNYRLCDVDGWGGQVPTCEVVKCPDIPDIENGRISRLSAESWEYGMVAEVSCLDDYSLIGEHKLICESNGNWNHPFPKCKDVKCPAPDFPETVHMVSIDKPTYKYQEEISFQCEEGYEMEGDRRIVCGEDGNFSPPLPTCTPRKCNQPPKLGSGALGDEYLGKDTFASGSRVSYVCNPGYTFTEYSRRSIACNKGVWEPLQATCTLKTCGSPGEILNGYYQGDNTFGSNITFYCNEGYKLVGRNYRLCEVDGWGGQVPTCEVVKCPDIPTIENGRISRPSTESWEYGMVAEVSCLGDYSLIGERKLICESNGNWNHPFPKCKDVKCPAPDFPETVRMTSIYKPIHKYQEEIIFRCKEGYEMEGDGRIVCGEDGNFSPPLPTCTPRKCNQPPKLENGALGDQYLGKDTFASGSRVSYVCNPGYTFTEYSRRSVACNKGVWEPLQATCTLKTCGSPGEILNGYYQGDNMFGSNITFYCNEGYKLVGRNYRLCEVDGWGGQVPTCEVVKCPDIPTIENEIISRPSAESWEYGMVAEVSCLGDYSLIGERKLTCESNGRWNHPFPKCKDVKCPAPAFPETVRMVSIDKPIYKYQEEISFRCKEGYEMEGDGRIVCGEDGNFSPPPPTCTPRKCTRPPELENGLLEDEYLMQRKFPSGSKVYYVCNPGYTFTEYSRRSITCNEGVWEPLQTTCTPKSCGSPGEIMNGYYQGNNSSGSKVTFYCYEGYALVGANYRLCEKGGWSGQVPTCEAVKCPDIPAIENGRVSRPSAESWEYGMVAEVSCLGDYSLIGERKLICESNGRWNHPFPKCKDVKCSLPDLPDNVRVVSKHKHTYKYQEQVLFQCKEGYAIGGNSVIVCGEDSNFSSSPPSCTQTSKRSRLYPIILGVFAIVMIILLMICFIYKRNCSRGSLMKNKKRDLENGEALSHQMEHLTPA